MNGKVIDVYLLEESEEFVPTCAFRDGSKRLQEYVLLMLLYTEPLHVVALSLFLAAFKISDFWHSYVYFLEGKR